MARRADCAPADRRPTHRRSGDFAEPPDPMALAAAVLGRGLAVVDGYVSPSRVRELIDCAARRRGRGDFRAARTGTPRAECAQRDAAIRGDHLRGDRDQGDRIRGDRICWLEEPLFPAERALLADLDSLRLMLNREAVLGAFDLEAHYADYPPGAGYARHVDQLQGRSQRVVSLVLYLNETWRPGAGGELRLFDGGDGGAADGGAGNGGAGDGGAGDGGASDGAAGGYRDIEPVAGRLVCFLTAAREHAVLPTRDPRLSITGWFRRRG